MSAGRFGWLWVLGSVLLKMVPNIIYNSPKTEQSLLDSGWKSLGSSFSLSCDLGHNKTCRSSSHHHNWTEMDCAFQRNSPWNLDNSFELNWVWILQQRILTGRGFFGALLSFCCMTLQDTSSDPPLRFLGTSECQSYLSTDCWRTCSGFLQREICHCLSLWEKRHNDRKNERF